VVARFAKFESLQKAMTIHRTKPGIRVEPVAVGGTVWHYLGSIRCLFAHVHARVKMIVRMGESQARMKAQPVVQVVRFCGKYSDRRLFER
jgi:hypothetical protein